MPVETPVEWTEQRASLLAETLHSSSLDGLAAMLWSLRRRLPVANAPQEAEHQARALGLIESSPPASLRLTPLGAKVSDSLTEYTLWKQRGKQHHCAEEFDALGVENLRGKRILEIGCGAGVNLLSLQRCARVVGVDVEPLYLQVSEVLARIEGVPPPARVCGTAERLPFEDASFDVALFHGSLPYMQIEPALREAARVLRPGGRAIAIQGELRHALRARVRARGWTLLRPGVFLREARGLGGMVLYPWVGRLILKRFDPVYATRRCMRRWFTRSGLRPNAGESSTGARERCYVADKPARGPAQLAPSAVDSR